MTARIYRYQLPIDDAPTALMPASARVLSAAESRTDPDSLDVWAEVRPDAIQQSRHFRIVGTGNPMPDDCGRFVDTVITHGGTFVWHVFEAATSA